MEIYIRDEYMCYALLAYKVELKEAYIGIITLFTIKQATLIDENVQKCFSINCKINKFILCFVY